MVLEIAVNEQTACYYVPGNGELVKSIALSGEMGARAVPDPGKNLVHICYECRVSIS